MDLETMLQETRDFVPYYFLEIKTEKWQNGIRQAQIVINTIRKLGMQNKITIITYDSESRWYIGTVNDIDAWRDTFDVRDIDNVHSWTRYGYFMSPFQNWTKDLVQTVTAKKMKTITYTPKTTWELLWAYREWVKWFMVDDIPRAISVLQKEQKKDQQ
jgi:glycerophosphoryl diester phosphodiesterase